MLRVVPGSCWNGSKVLTALLTALLTTGAPGSQHGGESSCRERMSLVTLRSAWGHLASLVQSGAGARSGPLGATRCP
jgi:hypothetical protein